MKHFFAKLFSLSPNRQLYPKGGKYWEFIPQESGSVLARVYSRDSAVEEQVFSSQRPANAWVHKKMGE